MRTNVACVVLILCVIACSSSPHRSTAPTAEQRDVTDAAVELAAPDAQQASSAEGPADVDSQIESLVRDVPKSDDADPPADPLAASAFALGAAWDTCEAQDSVVRFEGRKGYVDLQVSDQMKIDMRLMLEALSAAGVLR